MAHRTSVTEDQPAAAPVQSPLATWGLLWMSGILFLSWILPAPQAPPGADPPEHLNVRLQIQHTFQSRDPAVLSGRGKILETGKLRESLIGRNVFFHLDKLSESPVRKGDILNAEGVLSALHHGRKASGFDQYLRSFGIHLRLTRGTISHSADGSPEEINSHRTLTIFQKTQQVWENTLQAETSIRPTRQVLRSLLLGDSGSLPGDIRNQFVQTGTLHLFAISGLHIGILCWLIQGGLRLMRMPRLIAFAVSLFLIWFYILATEARPSAVRAGIFLSLFFLSSSVGRQWHPTSALLNAALIALILDPGQLFRPGFQLSYAVVTGLICVVGPVQTKLRESVIKIESPYLPQKFPAWIKKPGQAFLVSLVAFLFASPIVIAHFAIFTPLGVFLNPILGILVVAVLAPGACGLLLSAVGLPFPAELAFLTAEIPLYALLPMTEAAQTVPGAFEARSYLNSHYGPLFTFLFLSLLLLIHQRCNRSKSLPIWLIILPFVIIPLHITTSTLP